MMIVMSEADLAERGSDCEQRSPVVGGADTAWSGMLKPLRGRSRGKGERGQERHNTVGGGRTEMSTKQSARFWRKTTKKWKF